jgi:hypothetical protein
VAGPNYILIHVFGTVREERETSRQTAEDDLRRAEVWDRLVRIASPDDDGHVIWREHPEGKPTAPRRRRRVRRPPTREQGN